MPGFYGKAGDCASALTSVAICEQMAEALKNKNKRHTVVIRSTILPGTMRTIVIPLLEEFSGKKAGLDFGACNNLEFLREGSGR